jgi:hypothetical protein
MIVSARQVSPHAARGTDATESQPKPPGTNSINRNRNRENDFLFYIPTTFGCCHCIVHQIVYIRNEHVFHFFFAEMHWHKNLGHAFSSVYCFTKLGYSIFFALPCTKIT